MQRENSVKIWTTHFKQISNISNRMYLLKLYDKLIIILLTNTLAKFVAK